jgi:hypothetical protein
MRRTRAVTHIRLCAANNAKVAALDALAAEFMALCQRYVTFFCAEAEPNGFSDPCFPSPLSQRWQRVAIQQAAGVARSWRANHERAQEDFADHLVSSLEEEHVPEEEPPTWKPWQTPTLRKSVIQANANVAARRGDRELQATKTRQELKALLAARHQRWRAETGWS